MISVHTLFVLSVISAFGLVVAAPQSSDAVAKDGETGTSPEPPTTAKAEESPSEAPKSEPPKEAARSEGEKKSEPADGARSAAAKMLKEGVETTGDRIISDESLNSAVDKIVDIIHGERSINSKAEALPLSLGEKFDFLLLKIPKISGTKEVKKEEKEKPKEVQADESSGARNLGNPSTPCNSNGCCPCAQPTFQVQQAPVENPNPPHAFNNFNPTQDYVDPNCQQAQQLSAQILTPLSYRSLGMNEYESAARTLLGMQPYSQPLQYSSPVYGGPGPEIRPMEGYPVQNVQNGYFNNGYQINPDSYGVPYPYISSLYQSASPPVYSNSWNNDMNMYGYHKR